MNSRVVIRSTLSVVAAALVVGGATACDRDAGASVTDGSTPPVVTVTTSVSPPVDDSTPETVAPTESAENTPIVTGPAAVTTSTSASATPPSLPDYYGQWQGHDRMMTLNPDGSATVFLAAGANDTENWTATWAASGDGIEVTLGKLTEHHGTPLGNVSGTSWTGVLQPSELDGVTVLHMPNFTDWCAPSRFGNSQSCGA